MRRFPRRAALLASLLALPCCHLPPGTEVKRAIVPATATVTGENVSGPNDVARWLAGMPGGRNSPLADARRTAHWQLYSRNMDELWRRFSVQRQPRIAAFSRSQLGPLRHSDTVWYPFSGPDILFADAFFPGASAFVLCGLEGSDPLPDMATMDSGAMETGLNGLYTSLTTALSCSYFVTRDMRVDLQRTRFRGTLPIVLVFLARLGYDIQSLQSVSLDGAGHLSSGHAHGACPGYVVRCRTGGGRSKDIYYFTENVADFALRGDRRYLHFVSRFGPVVTYLKSASYLMHGDDFSIVRNAILQQSTAILQDDSGIPLSAFGDQWNLTFYGRYTGVLEIFKNHYQPELAQTYARGGPRVRDLDFGVGYKFEAGDSALMLARRK